MTPVNGLLPKKFTMAALLCCLASLPACGIIAPIEPTPITVATAPVSRPPTQPAPAPSRTEAPTVSAPAAATPTATIMPLAVLGDLQPSVQVRMPAGSEWRAGRFGDALGAGAELQTGEQGRARIVFSDGTILRMASASHLTIAEVQAQPGGSWLTRLQLWLGQIWISVDEDAATVETPAGVASVRGSFLGVTYLPGAPDDPDDDILIVTCLEGDCSLGNAAGSVNLTSGQKAVIVGRQPPLGPDLMTLAELNEWLENNPEILILLAGTDANGDLSGLATLASPGLGATATPGSFTIPTAAPASSRPSSLHGSAVFAGLAAFGGMGLIAAAKIRRRGP